MSFENFGKKGSTSKEQPKELTPEQAEAHRIMDNIAAIRRRSAERSAIGGQLTSPPLESSVIESAERTPESADEAPALQPKTVEYSPNEEMKANEVASLSAVKERLGIASAPEAPAIQPLEKAEASYDVRVLFSEAIRAAMRPGELNPGQTATAELMARNDEDASLSPEERTLREEAILDEWERYEKGRGKIDHTNIERKNGMFR